MDPLTHTLLGATLADSGLRRRTPLAAATLLVGANLPDLDVLSYSQGPDAALWFRRGWTHGILAWFALPLLLTLAVLAFDRLRRRWTERAGPPAIPRQILLLSGLAVATHPLLDWLNTYGIRLLMPFHGRWFYGDALFIIDPWIWLVLGGVLFLNHSRSFPGLAAWGLLGALTTAALFLGSGAASESWARGVWSAGLLLWIALRWRAAPTEWNRGPGAARKRARFALALAGAYALTMLAATLHVEGQVRREMAAAGIDPESRFMVGPVAIDPLAREAVIETPNEIRLAAFHWLASPRLELLDRRLPRRPPPSEVPPRVVDRALGASCVRGMVNWMRFPFIEADPVPGGYEVFLLDSRYVRQRAQGFGSARVSLDPDLGEPRCESRRF